AVGDGPDRRELVAGLQLDGAEVEVAELLPLEEARCHGFLERILVDVPSRRCRGLRGEDSGGGPQETQDLNAFHVSSSVGISDLHENAHGVTGPLRCPYGLLNSTSAGDDVVHLRDGRPCLDVKLAEDRHQLGAESIQLLLALEYVDHLESLRIAVADVVELAVRHPEAQVGEPSYHLLVLRCSRPFDIEQRDDRHVVSSPCRCWIYWIS